ncbi:MAG TPA: YtxH domain-containing protein [Candidatus Dormibacteraeota bacterium]|nr:YtxH domain-containing protein [Candidatus Dormibacteraeota bacterium]
MATDERTPQERIRAFTDAVDEELLTPTRRYLRGVRRGLIVGAVLGVLYAPRPGRESRARLLRAWRTISRHLPQRGEIG